VELSFSPDIDARLSCALVLLLGLLSAFRQVPQRLRKFKGARFVSQTWIFCLLRSGSCSPLLTLGSLSVVQDTSMFLPVSTWLKDVP